MDALVEMQGRHPSLGDVRGRGLMVGMEFVKDRETKEAGVALRDHVIQTAFENGLLLIPCGTNSLRITPPLNIDRALVEEGLAIFEQALTDAESTHLKNGV
jgi:4-aminobutyrate aminotransferase